MWPWGQIAAWARRKDPFLPSALSPSHCPTLKNKLCTLSANQLGNSWKFTSLPGRERRKWRGETLACAAGDRHVRQMQERAPWRWRCRGRTRGGVGKRGRWGEVQVPRSQTAAGHVGTLCRHFRVQHRLPGLSARMLPFHDLAAPRLSDSKSPRIPPKDLPGVSKREGQGGEEGGGGIRLSRNSIAPVAAPTARPPTNRNTVRCGASHVRIQSKDHPFLSLLPPPAPPPPPTLLLESATQHGFGSPHKPPKDTSLKFLACSSSQSYPVHPQFCAKQQAPSLSPLWEGACTPSSTTGQRGVRGVQDMAMPGHWRAVAVTWRHLSAMRQVSSSERGVAAIPANFFSTGIGGFPRTTVRFSSAWSTAGGVHARGAHPSIFPGLPSIFESSQSPPLLTRDEYVSSTSSSSRESLDPCWPCRHNPHEAQPPPHHSLPILLLLHHHLLLHDKHATDSRRIGWARPECQILNREPGQAGARGGEGPCQGGSQEGEGRQVQQARSRGEGDGDGGGR